MNDGARGRRGFAWRRIASAAFLLAASLALSSDVALAKAQPKRATRTCYDCHTEAKELFAKKKFTHAPVAKADCGACHLSHGFSQKLVLKKAPDELCRDCHQAVIAKAPTEHPHGAFAKGQCLSCHDPHASDIARLGREGGAESSCFRCHAPVREDAQRPVVHAPFQKSECASCHAAHGSKNAALLVAEGEALCATCHAGAAVEAKHANVVRGGLACLDCHAAHSSGNALLKTTLGPP